jgi:hypothetical protein
LARLFGAPPPPVAPFVRAARSLARREPCADHTLLAGLLASGVACHHADLSAEAREIVEAAFDAGAVTLLTATPTLAHGLNLTARNVLQWPRVWLTGGRRAREGALERWRWREQAGRAGRLGRGEGPGRAMLAAGEEAAEARLWRRYMLGQPSPPRGAVDGAAAGRTVLGALGAASARSEANLRDFLLSTFFGRTDRPAKRWRPGGWLSRGRAAGRSVRGDAALEPTRAAGGGDRDRTGDGTAAAGVNPTRTGSGGWSRGGRSWEALPAIWALALAARGFLAGGPVRTRGGGDGAALVCRTRAGGAEAAGGGSRRAVAGRRSGAGGGLAAGALDRPGGHAGGRSSHRMAGRGVCSARARGLPGWRRRWRIRPGRQLAAERAMAWRRLGARLACGAPPDGAGLALLGVTGLGRSALRRLMGVASRRRRRPCGRRWRNWPG